MPVWVVVLCCECSLHETHIKWGAVGKPWAPTHCCHGGYKHTGPKQLREASGLFRAGPFVGRDCVSSRQQRPLFQKLEGAEDERVWGQHKGYLRSVGHSVSNE